MANNLIQIKRSTTTSIPASLANGEMAYSSNGEILYIGSNGAVTAIAGKRFPGTLTANQALVANSTSAIDKVIVANLQPTGVYANGSLGTGGQVLTSNSTGVYWSSPTSGVAGSNTQVQYNNSGSLDASAGFTFDFAANSLNVSNTVNAASHTVGSSFIANSTAIVGTGYANISTSVNSALLTVGTNFIANSTGAYHTGTINAASHTVGTTFTANATLVNAAAINITGQVNTATLFATTSANVGGNVQITVSQFGVTGNSTIAPTMSLTGSALRIGNSTVTGAPSINLANSTGNTTVNAIAIGSSWGLSSNSSGIYHSGVVNAASHTVGSSFIANATAIVGTGYANISTSVNSALFTVGTAFTANATLVNAAAINIVNQVNTATFYATTSANVGTAFTANASLVNAIALNVVNTTNTQYLNVSKDVSISGNLSVTGSLVTINVATLSVIDPLIRLASNNTSTSDNLDIGIYGNYSNTTSSYYTALYRDNSSKNWKLLDAITSEPTTTITGGSQATLQAYLNSGGLVSNSSAVTLTANSTVAVNFTANSLSLSSALSGTSGGTGLSSYTSEDILVANSSNGFRKLGVGSEGYVLQVASGVVAYGTLDGGTF